MPSCPRCLPTVHCRVSPPPQVRELPLAAGGRLLLRYPTLAGHLLDGSSPLAAWCQEGALAGDLDTELVAVVQVGLQALHDDLMPINIHFLQ